MTRIGFVQFLYNSVHVIWILKSCYDLCVDTCAVSRFILIHPWKTLSFHLPPRSIF